MMRMGTVLKRQPFTTTRVPHPVVIYDYSSVARRQNAKNYQPRSASRCGSGGAYGDEVGRLAEDFEGAVEIVDVFGTGIKDGQQDVIFGRRGALVRLPCYFNEQADLAGCFAKIRHQFIRRLP